MNAAGPFLSELLFDRRNRVRKRHVRAVYHAASTPDRRRAFKKQLPGLRWPGIWGHIRSRIPELFQISLTDVLLSAWETHQLVRTAAAKSLQQPRVPVRVAVHEHSVRSHHHPRVEFFYQGRRVADIKFDLELKLTFESMLLVIQDGRLLEMEPGACQGTATLLLDQHRILSRRLGRIHWPGRMSFGEGIPLVRSAGSPARPAGPPAAPTLPAQLPSLPAVRRRAPRCLTTLVIVVLGALCIYLAAAHPRLGPRLDRLMEETLRLH